MRMGFVEGAGNSRECFFEECQGQFGQCRELVAIRADVRKAFAMAVAVVRAIEPHAQRHYVYFKRPGGCSTSLGHSSGDLLAHFYSRVLPAPLDPGNIVKTKLADRICGAGDGVGDTGNATNRGVDVSSSGRLLRGGDDLPRRNCARSSTRAASD